MSGAGRKRDAVWTWFEELQTASLLPAKLQLNWIYTSSKLQNQKKKQSMSR